MSEEDKNSEVKRLLEQVDELFSDIGLEDEDMHKITNLALLDRDTNSQLNNSVFPIKKDLILKAGHKGGKYILPGTRKVFLKHYTEPPTQQNFWSKADREAYGQAIQKKIQRFVKVSLSEKGGSGE